MIMAGVYRHYKGGYYQVLGVGEHTETHERVVVYVALDASLPGPRIRVRPLNGPEGFCAPASGMVRFTYIGSEVSA